MSGSVGNERLSSSSRGSPMTLNLRLPPNLPPPPNPNLNLPPNQNPSPNPRREDVHFACGTDTKEREWRIWKRWGGWRGLGYGGRWVNGRGSARGWRDAVVVAALDPVVSGVAVVVNGGWVGEGEGAVGEYGGVGVYHGGGLQEAVVSNAHAQTEEAK